MFRLGQIVDTSLKAKNIVLTQKILDRDLLLLISFSNFCHLQSGAITLLSILRYPLRHSLRTIADLRCINFLAVSAYSLCAIEGKTSGTGTCLAKEINAVWGTNRQRMLIKRKGIQYFEGEGVIGVEP